MAADPSSRFTRPIIDLNTSVVENGKIRSIPELIEYNAMLNPTHLFCWQAKKQTETSDSAFLKITHAQLRQAIQSCSAWLTRNVTELSLPYKNELGAIVRGPPIALLVDSDVGLLIYLWALMCLGVPVLLLSARLSAAAIGHLLSKTSAKAIVVSPRLRNTVTEALSIDDSTLQPAVIYMQTPYETFLHPEENASLFGEHLHVPNHFISENDREVLILHSSGTTGLPKPIYTSHRHSLGFAACHEFVNDEEAHALTLSTLPLYHAFGLVAPCLSLGVGMTFCLPPSSTVPTGFSTVKLLKLSGAKALLTVPSILEEIVLLPGEEGFDALKPLQFVGFGGGLPKVSVGKKLEVAGVQLLNHYGTTETGPLAPLFVPTPTYDWRYFRLRADLKAPLELRLEPSHLLKDGVMTHTLILRPFGWPTLFEVQDQLISNPQRPDSDFSAVGRNDDMIILANGEKVIPRILESMLSQSEIVKAAVAFGDGQLQIGVLLEPTLSLAPDEIKDFKLSIWPIVQEATRQMDAHGQISCEDAIVVVPPGSIPRADKGTILRREAYRVFEKELAQAYVSMDTVFPHSPLDMSAIEQCLKHLVQTRLNWKLLDEEWTYDDDLFELGMDSLQATQLRRLLTASLPNPSSHLGAQALPLLPTQIDRDFVYRHPSITKMARILRSEGLDEPGSSQNSISDMVDLYSVKNVPLSQESNRSVILLTGSTGSFGSYALAHLVNLSSVTSVICLNRPSKQGPYKRQEESFAKRGLELSKHAWGKIQIQQTNCVGSNLGLQEVDYARLRKQVTHILHNAWPMDFNRLLPSFTAQFRTLQNLLIFAREIHAARPLISPKVLFISSISAVGLYQRVHTESIVPEMPVDDENCALRLGYAKAKFVCERIIERAAHDFSGEIEAAYVRFGQIAGAQRTGYWNADEHVAALIKSSEKLGKLPCIRGTHSWLPVDCAAHAVSELLLGPGPMELVYHMENPIRQSWRDTLEVFASKLNLTDSDFISFDQWIDKVRTSTDDENPAKKLGDFFQQDFERMSGGSVILATEKARGASSTLRAMTAVSKETLEAFVDQWRIVGFLDQSKLP